LKVAANRGSIDLAENDEGILPISGRAFKQQGHPKLLRTTLGASPADP
jgi:hypothetical protein